MIPIIIFLLSIGLQLTAAVVALLLIRTTGRKLAWILIALAMVLMASRRIVTFISLLSAGKEITFTIPELIALVVSILMLFGVLRIGKYFRSIRLAEEKFRILSDSTTEGIAIHEEGKILLVNRSFARMFGYELSEVIGRNALELAAPESRDLVSQNILSGYDEPYNAVGLRKDGTTFIAEIIGKNMQYQDRPVRITIIRDITERKEAEKFLQESEERFRKLSDFAIEGIVIHEKGIIVDANQSYAMMFGYELSEVIGKNTQEFVAPEFREIVLEKVITEYEKPYEAIGLKKDGTTIIVEVIGKSITYHGRRMRVAVLWDITERKKTEEERAFLANITENASDAIVGLDLDTKIVSWSRGAERIFGYSAEEVVGRSWSMLVPEEALEACRERFKKVIIEGFVETVETVRIAKFGRRFPSEMTLTILNDKSGNHIGYVSITRDITERKRIEKSLKESEEKYRDLIESANDLIQSVDADMRFLFVNKKWKDVLGYSDEEIRNLVLTDIIKRDTIPHCMEAFKKVIDGYAVQNIEAVFVSKNGNEIFVEGNVDVYIKDGKFVSTRGIFRDVTERRKLEEQLRHAQKMQAIGQLAGGIAHEFNNILTTIVGYGDMLLMKMREGDPLRHNVEQILASSERAANLTQGLLTYSRKQATMLKPVSLNDIIRKTEGLLMKVISEDIELRTVITGKDLTVMADRSQIEQVLVNLATNAKDAMPDGGILTIEIHRIKDLDIRTFSEKRIVSNLKDQRTEIEEGFAGIFVTDTGTGIDKDTKERIFEPFFTTKDIGKGTGLGLAVVYGIIKQHDGYIYVYSEPGKGTTFKMYLPIIKSKVEEETEPSAISLPAGGSEMVLIAEDDKALRTLIKTVLNEFGYKVIDAVDGEDAIEKFIQNKDEIELAILDVIMPKKNGKEVYEEIKKIRPDIKTIFASGYTADIIQKKGVIEEGMDFILKPVSPKNLLKKVREVLDR
ncbi:MAG: PAS domain S-box protein [Nitrospirae bacterium]|nr:PAS domain S-box protein [Nitrospirota bacterium]